MTAISCPSKYNTEFNDILKNHGETIASKVWNMLGDAIVNPDLVRESVDLLTSQAKIVEGLNKSNIQENIVAKLQNPAVKLDGINYVNQVTGEMVKFRVSNYKKQFEIEVQKYDLSASRSDFYAKKGTALHAYLEAITKTLLAGKIPNQTDIKTSIINELKTSEQFKGETDEFFNLTGGQFDMLVGASRNLIDEIRTKQKEIDKKGKAEIFTEIVLYDDIHETAGTADMIAIFSDGSASVYDFKSYVGKAGFPPYTGKIEGWEVQMQNYKEMLKRVYGVTKFRETRVIPLQVQYNKKINGEYVHINNGFERVIAQTKNNKDKTEYLNPIPIKEYTGVESTDKLLEHLYTQIKNKRAEQLSLQESKNQRYYKLGREIGRHQRAINEILLNRDINGVIGIVNNLYKSVKKRLHLSSNDPNHISLSELTDIMDEFKLYSNLQSYYHDEIEEMSDEHKATVYAQLMQVNKSILAIDQELKQKLLEHYTEDIREAGDTPSQLGRMFQGLANYNMPVFREFNKYLRYAGEQTRRESLDEIKYIQKVDAEFSTWAKQNGYSQMGKFDLLYDAKKGRLVQEFTDDFWKQVNEIKTRITDKKVTSEDSRFIRENFDFDMKGYEAEKEMAFKSIKYDIEEQGIANVDAEYLRRTTLWLKTHQAVDSEGNFLLSNRYIFKFLKPKKNNDNHLTKEWKFIQQHKPVKDYYDMYIKYNEEFGEQFGRKKVGRYFVPEVRQNVIDKFTEMGIDGVNNIGASIQRAYALNQEDDISGARDAEGNIEKKIPLLFATPLRNPINKSEKALIIQEIDEEGVFEKGTIEYDAEVKRRVDIKEFEKGRAIKSRDLTKSLMLFVHSAIDNRNLSNIEGNIKGLKFLLDNEMVASYSLGDTERKIVNKFTKEIFKKIGFPTDLIETFDKFTNMFLYKRRFDKDFVMFKNYSGNKIVTSFMNYLSIKALGLNMVITSANFIQARTSMYMKAKEDLHFGVSDYKDLLESFKPSSRRDEKWNMLVEYFEPTTRNIVREKTDSAGANAASRLLTQRTAFIGHILGDENVDNSLLILMSKRYRVDSDGIIKNPKLKTLIDENAPTVFESIEMIDGKPIIKGLTLEAAADFRAKVQKIAYQIKGMTSEEHKGLFTNNIVWSALMQFKSWIPGLYEERMGKLRYDETLEYFDQGKFSVAMGEIVGKGILPALNTTMKLMLEVVAMGKVTIDSEYAKNQLQQFIKENPQFHGKLTVEDMIQMKRAKLNSLVGELRIYLGFFLLVQLLGGLDWDDEDEEGNLFTWNAHQIARRALLEISFWYSPSSMTEIVRSPLPLIGVFTEAQKMFRNSIVETAELLSGNENERDKTPYLYYTLKNTPIVNQGLRVTGYFNEFQRPKSVIQQVIDINN